ncbi:hypothetical protein C2G38_2044584 [Gigaspora rosea]|uniref:Uncharacterized protein n=1 Tax=Gigaspora rosea TaxID=44941 RepID=A0A397UHS6_9GLOM|nr:hypothetical protein C2G38_2044584 [Gigaspora rosea]
MIKVNGKFAKASIRLSSSLNLMSIRNNDRGVSGFVNVRCVKSKSIENDDDSVSCTKKKKRIISMTNKKVTNQMKGLLESLMGSELNNNNVNNIENDVIESPNGGADAAKTADENVKGTIGQSVMSRVEDGGGFTALFLELPLFKVSDTDLIRLFGGRPRRF